MSGCRIGVDLYPTMEEYRIIKERGIDVAAICARALDAAIHAAQAAQEPRKRGRPRKVQP